jgi:uracil-DNA glycosylase family 4
MTSLTLPTTVTEDLSVPNLFPTNPELVPYRIAIIGECPGIEEQTWRTCQVCRTEYPKQRYDSDSKKYMFNHVCPQCRMDKSLPTPKPFVGGAVGRMLNSLLTEVGIKKSCCYLGYLSNYKPADGKFDTFLWTGREISLGLGQLKQDMVRFQPNLIILLGKHALRAARGSQQVKKKTVYPSLDSWRGSVFMCEKDVSPFLGFKCMATYHPFTLFQNWDNLPIARFDLTKARRHAETKTLPPEDLVLDTSPKFETIVERLRLIKQHKITISVDIEGYPNAVSCLSISPTPKEAFIIPFYNPYTGDPFWSLEQEGDLLAELDTVFADPTIKKVLQNGMYDRFVLAHTLKLLIRNMYDDTLIKNWEIYSEFPKDLGFLTSIHTDHAFYKDEGKLTDMPSFWKYCCKDSAITYEISNRQSKILERYPQSNTHYRFNMSLSDPFLFIELKGMRLDTVKKAKKVADLKALAWFDNKAEESGGTEQLKFELGVGRRLNVRSSKEMCKFLYEELQLPVVYRKRPDGGRSPSADFEALLTLGLEHNNPLLQQAIAVRRLLKQCSDIEGITPEPNGRVLSSTNIVGTKTGRTTSSKAPTGEGTNLHTISKPHRDMFLADNGHDFGQCDLEGADSWTVAAHCARLGDPTMLEDLLAGLKPAKVLLALLLHGPQVNNLPRQQLKALIKTINDPDKYLTCKKASHGSNYRMGAKHLSELIFFDTDGEIHISGAEAKKLQDLYFLRYKGVRYWHEWVEKELKTKGFLVSASGSRRLFFGRKDASTTIGDACSTEPQHNTTYVCNLALSKLWNDPDNQTPSGHPRIWPCHQVHDALCLQWKFEDREYARAKIHTYFNNPVVIAGTKITIPFEGNYGPSWGEQTSVI